MTACNEEIIGVAEAEYVCLPYVCRILFTFPTQLTYFGKDTFYNHKTVLWTYFVRNGTIDWCT